METRPAPLQGMSGDEGLDEFRVTSTRDIGMLLKRLIGEKIQLTVTHVRDLGPVRADPTQVRQVLLNLSRLFTECRREGERIHV